VELDFARRRCGVVGSDAATRETSPTIAQTINLENMLLEKMVKRRNPAFVLFPHGLAAVTAQCHSAEPNSMANENAAMRSKSSNSAITVRRCSRAANQKPV